MNIEEYNYDLPEKFIAQTPLSNRSDSKLLLLNKDNGVIKEEVFKNIINYLNDTPPDTHMYLTVDGIGRYENVFAFRIKKTEVVSMLIKNKQPHITCVLDPTTNKPVDSNKISKWVDIKPIKIDTICKVINKHKRK